MKNRRDICYTKDAGFVHYPGFPGQIKTGCVASPAFKSRFCQQHSARLHDSIPSFLPVVHWDGMDSTNAGMRGGTVWDVPTPFLPSFLPMVHRDGMDSRNAGMRGGTVWDVPTLSLSSHGTLGWDGQ